MKKDKWMNTEIKCKYCESIILQQSITKKKRICDQCKIIKRSEYYRKWYENNGCTRNRNSGYNIHMHEYMKEWKKNNPEKVAAHKTVALLLKSGILENPNQCSECKKTTNYLDAHHEDYSKPTEIIWLCPRCHGEKHKIIESQLA